MAIHGNKSQTARTKALADFKRGELQVLVATDIAARGIDIDQLPHVVNYELPNVPEDYVHRIGRTGRAGATGEAISLVCVDEEIFLRDIETAHQAQIPREVVPGFEPDPSEKAEPIVLGRMTIGVGGTRRNAGGGGGGGGGGRGGSVGGGAVAAVAAPPAAAARRPRRAATAVRVTSRGGGRRPGPQSAAEAARRGARDSSLPMSYELHYWPRSRAAVNSCAWRSKLPARPTSTWHAAP